MKENTAEKSYLRPSIAVSALAVVFVLHFFFTQFVALESDRDAALREMMSGPNAEIETGREEKKPDAAVALAPHPDLRRAPVAPAIEAGSSPGAGSDKVIKTREQAPAEEAPQQPAKSVKPSAARKKEARDPRAERLRRAEKILTGI